MKVSCRGGWGVSFHLVQSVSVSPASSRQVRADRHWLRSGLPSPLEVYLPGSRVCPLGRVEVSCTKQFPNEIEEAFISNLSAKEGHQDSVFDVESRWSAWLTLMSRFLHRAPSN